MTDDCRMDVGEQVTVRDEGIGTVTSVDEDGYYVEFPDGETIFFKEDDVLPVELHGLPVLWEY